MDPLIRLKEAHSAGRIPDDIYDLVLGRFPITVAGIDRIEKASGMMYPAAYIEPSLIVTASNSNMYEYGILFARTIPITYGGIFQVMIQISAPLVAYGLRGTVHAILAHEFLHYMDLMRRISKMDLLSDEISGNLFENVYGDETRLVDPRAVFADRTLLGHITKRFPAGFRDYKLEDKVTKFWIGRDLPKYNISLDANTVKLSAETLSQLVIDPDVAAKIRLLEEKSSKIRTRQIY